MSAHWKDVKQQASMNQDGSSGFPPHWAMKHFEDNLDIAPLRFGGDDYGYLMWFRPQSKSVVNGMRILKGALQDLDEALARIAELEAGAPGNDACLLIQPLQPEPPSVVLTKVPSGSGADAYDARCNGESWPSIGERMGLGSPLNAAKRHARTHGLPWPPSHEL